VVEGAEWLKAGAPNWSAVTAAAYQVRAAANYIVAPAEASSNLARSTRDAPPARASCSNIVESTRHPRGRLRPESSGGDDRHLCTPAGYYDAYYLRAQKVRTLIKQDFEDCFAQGVHAILTPATPSAAFGIGEKTGADPIEMYLNDIFTVTVNMAGLPGIAVPAGRDGQGLPFGLQ